jgi:DNA-binding response OmpR family regulator
MPHGADINRHLRLERTDMSLERILLIKQYRDSNVTECKKALESSPEHYSVVVANSYDEGRMLLRERTESDAERLRLVIIDSEDVDAYTLELLENIRGSDSSMPITVLTKTASSKTRQSLTLLSTECIIKTGEYEKFLWQAVKGSLARNFNSVSRMSTKPKRVFRPFVATKKKA